jgi:hypothetical protein
MNKIEDEHVNSERIVRGFRHFIFRHIPVNIPLFRFPNRCGPIEFHESSKSEAPRRDGPTVSPPAPVAVRSRSEPCPRRSSAAATAAARRSVVESVGSPAAVRHHATRPRTHRHAGTATVSRTAHRAGDPVRTHSATVIQTSDTLTQR